MKRLLVLAILAGILLVPLPILPQPEFKSVLINQNGVETYLRVSVVRDYDHIDHFDYFINAKISSSKFGDFSECFETSGILIADVAGQRFTSTTPTRYLDEKIHYIYEQIAESSLPLSEVTMTGEFEFASACGFGDLPFEFNEKFVPVEKRHSILSLFFDMLMSV